MVSLCSAVVSFCLHELHKAWAGNVNNSCKSLQSDKLFTFLMDSTGNNNFMLMLFSFVFCSHLEVSRNCTTSSFRCPNNGNCIPQVWVCDGDPDCDGGADERDCSVLLSRTCPPSQHRCGNGACLPNEWRCDGDPDCSDMSDEMGCQQTSDGGADGAVDRDCGADEFQCASGHCIKGAYRCDGEIHCRYYICIFVFCLWLFMRICGSFFIHLITTDYEGMWVMNWIAVRYFRVALREIFAVQMANVSPKLGGTYTLILLLLWFIFSNLVFGFFGFHVLVSKLFFSFLSVWLATYKSTS